MIKLCAALLTLEGALLLAWVVRRDVRDDRALAAFVGPVDVMDAVRVLVGR